jgi:hypothetical protein
MILNANNIRVLTFPSHYSHVLQLFDMPVASPLKAAFKDAFTRFENEVFKGIGHVPRQKSARLRRTLVPTFVKVCRAAMILANCACGFKPTGLFPYDPSQPMSAKFCLDTTAETRAFREANRGGAASERPLTHEHEIVRLPSDGNATLTFDVLESRLGYEWTVKFPFFNTTRKGRAISPVPRLWRGDDEHA